MKIFVIPKKLSINVIESQILERALVYSDQKITLVSNQKNIARIKKNLNKKFKKLVLKSYKYINHINSEDIEFIYTREFQDFLYFYIKRYFIKANYAIHYDFRGIISEESYLRNKSNLRKILLNFLEKFIFFKSDELYCVSNNMKNYLLTKYASDRNIKVIPCCINSQEITKKKKFNSTKGMLRFVYLGSINVWQGFEKSLQKYMELEKITNCVLTVITNDIDEAKKVIDKNSIENYEIKSLSREESLKELQNHDFGLIYRENNIVNSTSSPIKVLEYLSKGVVPLITDFVGDYSYDLQKESISIYIDQDNEKILSDLNKLRNDERVFGRIFNYCQKMSWEKQKLEC